MNDANGRQTAPQLTMQMMGINWLRAESWWWLPSGEAIKERMRTGSSSFLFSFLQFEYSSRIAINNLIFTIIFSSSLRSERRDTCQPCHVKIGGYVPRQHLQCFLFCFLLMLIILIKHYLRNESLLVLTVPSTLWHEEAKAAASLSYKKTVRFH